ncbi:MAG: lysylphosphatidylglycerol synthase transmembrane domain-containing protein [Candidatus Aminicenantales bacterium]
MNLKSPRSWIKGLLTAVGVLLFFYLVRRIGFKTLGANLSRFGPWFILTSLLAAGWIYCQSVAWWLIQKGFFRRVPLGLLYRIKIISGAFNLVLPSASLGGDAMRAFMIKKNVPLKEGIPSVLFDKTLEFIASTFFLTCGFLLGLITIRLPRSLTIPVIVSLGITATATFLLILAQKTGVKKIVARVGSLIPGGRAWIEKREIHLEALDQNLRLLYSRSNRKAILPFVLHVIGRLLGTVEVMIILAVLKAPVNFIQAIFICTVVTVGNSIFFILPGQWGVMESVHILVLQSLGYPAAIGLSLSVIRRIRSLLFVGLGLILFASGKRKSPPPEGS